MRALAPVGRGTLWARMDDRERGSLPLWKAALIAAVVELLLPLLVFGVDWSFLHFEPPLEPVKVMTVEIREPPQEPPPLPPPPKKALPKRMAVPIELPKPVPGEKPSKIELPAPEPEVKPEPKPKPDPEPEPEPEEKLPEPGPELEAPALPSVFQDVKPVRKVRIRYPREAEDQHIQGRVKVRLTVSPEGKVTAVETLLSEPPGVFDEAVLEGVRQYLFKKDGTTFTADQDVVFRIDE